MTPAPLLTFPVPAAERERARERGAIPEIAGQSDLLLPPPPSLPPFLRPKGAGDGISRRPVSEVEPVLMQPHGPAAPPLEDLSGLADKLKRILDEEARRHGIPV